MMMKKDFRVELKKRKVVVFLQFVKKEVSFDKYLIIRVFDRLIFYFLVIDKYIYDIF